jgi:hypothetical protein
MSLLKLGEMGHITGEGDEWGKTSNQFAATMEQYNSNPVNLTNV